MTVGVRGGVDNDGLVEVIAAEETADRAYDKLFASKFSKTPFENFELSNILVIFFYMIFII